MPAELRHIAIHVEEPEPGDFRWVLTERTDGDTWAVRSTSDSAASTYQQAMADGLLALQEMVDDLDVGPRHPGQADLTSHRGAADDESAVAGGVGAEMPSFFGFGPAR